MANQSPINFFDILSTLPASSKSWSPNTLKTRLVLNYKKIPYTQSWISYPDIAPLLSSLQVPANSRDESPFTHTLPAIGHASLISPSNSHGIIMESFAIAEHLERVFPEPTLFPSGAASYALALAINRLISCVIAPGLRALVPPVADFLDQKGREYFVRTRSVKFGKALGEVRPADPVEVRKIVDEVKREFMVMARMLSGCEQNNSSIPREGPYFEGKNPGYADFIVVAFLGWCERADREIWKELIGVGEHGQIRDLWDACLPWLEGQGEELDWEFGI